jgi:3D-(3,5/4)-trihydroxycyclohexane-1,2-dione acylhydrolase (decyclizing)
VLQQVEDFRDGTISANDCLKPVSRYFDRIMRPEQLLAVLPRAISVLTDAAMCGPVTLALPQDVQTMAYDFPESFFSPGTIVFRAPPPDGAELRRAAAILRKAKRPLIIAGGGVLYGLATDALRSFVDKHAVPVSETQAGKGALPWDHPLQQGAIGVTGSPAANALAKEADVALAVGTRLQDFMTGSHSLFPQATLVNLNVNAFDALKWRGVELIADAGAALSALSKALSAWKSAPDWATKAKKGGDAWRADIARITGNRNVKLPYEGEVIGAVQRSAGDSTANDIVVCAAGTLPADLHKLWRTSMPGGYHMEYGYSCMGYEIAGGLGAKMARPEREVVVLVGDGSYLMLNSEIATSLLLDQKLVVVVLDNHGYGCINRLQQACGGAPFNNLFADSVQGKAGAPKIDFAAHAAALGALAENVKTIPQLEAALKRARAADRTCVVCIETDPNRTTEEGGWWWEVAVPEVSERESVRKARAAYDRDRKKQQP